jgi:hypothetical protein
MPVEVDARRYYRAIDAYGDPIATLPLLDHASYTAAVGNLRQAAC